MASTTASPDILIALHNKATELQVVSVRQDHRRSGERASIQLLFGRRYCAATLFLCHAL